MILRKLYELYGRLEKDPAYELAPPGYSAQKVTFAIVLHPDGRLHGINDIREQVEIPSKKGPPKINKTPRTLLLPGLAKPSGSGINPCTLWDNSAYLLGYTTDEKKAERAPKTFGAFSRG
jgi:CRISPR-associated protein Csd1